MNTEQDTFTGKGELQTYMQLIGPFRELRTFEYSKHRQGYTKQRPNTKENFSLPGKWSFSSKLAYYQLVESMGIKERLLFLTIIEEVISVFSVNFKHFLWY